MFLLLICLSIIAAAIALGALRRLTEAERRIAGLSHRLQRLEQRQAGVGPESENEIPDLAVPEAQGNEGAAAAETPSLPGHPAPSTGPRVPSPGPRGEAPTAAESRYPLAGGGAPSPGSGAPAASRRLSAVIALERNIGTRWAVWLGGFMLALGAVFLVRYSIEQGYFGPAVRVALGVLLSAVLLGAGEKLRRTPSMGEVAGLRGTAIPPVLTAAGIVAAFATVYAAYAIYEMTGPAGAFVLLAAVSLASVGLAIVHGPFLAALGLLGSFSSPGLVSTPNPSSVALFSYLIFVAAAALWVARLRHWWRIGLATVAGVSIWPLLWLVTAADSADKLVLSLYVPLVSALACWAAALPGDDVSGGEPPQRPRTLLASSGTVAGGCVLAAVLLFKGFAVIPLAGLGLYAALIFACAYRCRGFETLAILSAAAVVVALAMWTPVPSSAGASGGLSAGDFLTAPLVPRELQRYIAVTSLFAAFYGVAGFFALLRRGRPQWAGLSATVPPVLFVVLYRRATAWETSLVWAASGAVLALVAAASCEFLRRRRGDWNAAVGAYAVAGVAAVALGLAMVLREAWLTVALSLMLPAIAVLARRLNLAFLRPVACIIAATVIVRLALNPALLTYDVGSRPLLNLLLYAYGLPALSFAAAASWFRRERDGRAVRLMEAGCALLTTLLVSLELNHWMSGGELFAGEYGLAQQAVQTLAWLVLSLSFYRAGFAGRRVVFATAAELLRWLAVAQIVAGHLVFCNPLRTGDPVGEGVVFNLLLLAYLAPALLAALYCRTAGRAGDRAWAGMLGFVSVVMMFCYLSLEVRQLFHGTLLTAGATSDAEWYSYSLVWLLYGGALLLAGFKTAGRELRLASFVVIFSAVAKAFCFDMSNLSGILRAASFLGFGVALIGVGMLYQRFIFPPPNGGDE